MKVKSLYVGQGSTGIKGKGTQHFASLLRGILTPTSGSLYLNIYECKNLSRKILQQKIGIVPQDPIAYDVSIQYKWLQFVAAECTTKTLCIFHSDILNPEKSIALDGVKSALQRFHLWETVTQLPNELDESFNKLSRHDRQLLCLAKCWLLQCPVIVIERPHLYTLNYVKEAMNTMFMSATIVVIGLCEEQLNFCQNSIDVDAKKNK